MTQESTRELFARAAVAMAAFDMEKVERLFLETIANGVPDGVQVIYLFAESAVPGSLEAASFYDVFLLECEGQEGQDMPVPMLVQLDAQLAQSLFDAAEFRRLEEDEDDDWDDDDWDAEDAMECGDDYPWGDLDGGY